MAATYSRRFFGDAWASLKTTRNLFGKLCLLALIQFVPILGQIVAFAYFLGWAREAAWGMETPLPAHVFGRTDRNFWGRGAKAFVVSLLYALIVTAFAWLVWALGAVTMHVFEFSHTGIEVTYFVCSLVEVAVAFVLCLVYIVGLMRLAIYNRFGAAFQWGACLKMLGHDFGGMVKIVLTALVACVVMGIPALLASCALLPAVFGTGLTGSFVGSVLYWGDTSQVVLEQLMEGFGLSLLITVAACAVVGFLLEVVVLMVEALMWRCMGNWVAQFDVPAWGGRYDKLPFECASVLPEAPEAESADSANPVDPTATADAPEAGAADAEDATHPAADAAPLDPALSMVPQLEQRCHPVLVGVLSSLVAIAVALAASLGSLSIAMDAYGEPLTVREWEQMLDELLDELDELVESPEYGYRHGYEYAYIWEFDSTRGPERGTLV